MPKVKLPSFNLHIQPQLNEIIADLLSECNPAEDFLEPLKAAKWWTHPQFKDMPLWYGKAEMSIEDWAIVAEALENVTFIPQLKQQLAETIEYQWQIRMQEYLEDIHYELKEIVGL